MDIDESEFESLVEKYKENEKPIVEYNKQELDAFIDEGERASAYMSNHFCLPKAQFAKCMLVRNNLLAMHHKVAEPEVRTENVDYRSIQAHWKTGEVTVLNDNYSTDQAYYHLCGCTMFKSRKAMVTMIVNRYLEDYKSDEEEDKLGFGNHYDSTLDQLEESKEKDGGSKSKTEVEKKLIDMENFDKNKLSVLGKRCFEEMQSLEKDRDITIEIDSSSDEDDSSSSDSDSESLPYSDYDDDSDGDKWILRKVDPELHYDEMEFGIAGETHLSDFSRWCLYGYTPMKREDELDEFPINCSRIEVDFEKKKILFSWCFKYNESVGNAILQKADYLSMLLNEKICIRKYSEQWTKFAFFDGLTKEDLIEFVAQQCQNKVDANKLLLNDELTRTIHFKPFFELQLKKTVKDCDSKKKLILQERHDIIGRKYSVIYNPDDDKLYFYDPIAKLVHKEWTMELSFKQCRNINKRMLDIWVAEDKKIDEMKNSKFNENMNKKLKI